MGTKAGAYARQARADFDAYVASGLATEPPIAEHYRLQLLQMALEKVAKAFLYDAEPLGRFSHHVVVHVLNALKRHKIAEAVGMKLPVFSRELDAARPILLEVESASPSVGNDGRGLTREESERTANVEYPWQARDEDPESWVTPALHSFGIVRRLRNDPRSARAVTLLDRLIDAALTVLPE